ncbi:MAG: type I-U CRISPR-associated protein Cas7 [Planctomycetes bacterium]|nr:type I-U CRISPR-associated protein Cas7 [Planctomycetota bacterium]
MPDKLTLKVLQEAVAGRAAAFRCKSTLSPAGGPGDKVFPPTYAGAVYATEKRRLPGHDQPIDCVLLDSVQSQANRMEEALQQAVDDGRLRLPVIEVDFDPYYPGKDQPEEMRLLDPVGKVTSLQAPHRIADAILRDSMLDGQRFRESDFGKRVSMVSARDATVLFELCPTALLLGMWDSTGPKGGLGAKFERAMVSEIVGINATYGVRTSSRVDPVIGKNPTLYETEDGEWTALEAEAMKTGKEGEPKKYAKKLSELNLGSVTPDFARYSSKSITKENRETVDVMRQDSQYITAGRVSPGGVTIDHAEQTIVLSLPALRRLHFPVNGKVDRQFDIAARTVLAALGLCAAALADDAGLDLRSRCLLYPEQDLTWTLLDRKADKTEFTLPADEAVKLLTDAVAAATKAGLPWRDEPLVLQPSDQLVKLVVKSQHLAVQQGGDGGEGGE